MLDVPDNHAHDLGLLEPPYHFSFIMGVLGGIPATARHLAFQAEQA
ncbi:MAG TPA: 3-keto-5-aminohexanoate cleavage protein, partial [Kofleriaceae bacterium]